MVSIPVDGAVLSALALGICGAAPVVMLHGLVTGNMASWYSNAALPLSATHRVVLYDQRGHGDSTMPESGFDLPGQANDLDRVLAHFDLAQTPVDLVGHSMGALIALHFALRSKQRVRRLVLVDAPMPACLHVAPSLRRIAAGEGSQCAAAGPAGRRVQRLRARLQTLLHGTTLLRDIASMHEEADHQLGDFDRKTLLIYGTRSPCRESAVHLHAALPCAALAWLDAGHDLPTEAPRPLLDLIQDFLDAPEPAPQQVHRQPEAVA